jgi:proton glutamate symport protein
VLAQVEGKNAKDLVGVFLRMIPENIVADAAAGNLLGVIVFAILFGIFLNRIPAEPQRSLVGFFRGVEQVMLELTHAVLRLSPLGVFALVAKVAMTTGFAAVKPLGWFVVTVLGALVIHAFVVVPILLVTVARVNPLRHFRGMAPALLMAFSTASSSGTLPLTMQSASRLGISERVTGFTLPLGATVNMDGTALYECVAAVFIAQAYGVDLGFAQLFVIALVALLTSVGVAGIPAASLVAIALILTSMGLPLEGLGLILAVDRVLDMCRTSVNVLGDSTVAACVQRLVPAGEGAAEGASPG